MRATVLTFAVASLIVVAPSTPAYSQDSATAVTAATQQTQTPAVGSDTIQFGGRTIAAGDTVNGPVLAAAGDLRVRGVIRGTAIAVAGDIILEEGGSITGDAIAILGTVVTIRGSVGGAARNFAPAFAWLDAVDQPVARRGTSDAMSLSLGWLAVMLLIGFGVLVFAGAYLDGVTDVLEQNFSRSFLVGIAGELGVIPLMVLVCAALALTVVGILLIPFAIVAYVLAVAGFLTLGFLSVARLAGGSFGTKRGEPRGKALRGLVFGIGIFMGLWVLAAAFQWSPAISGVLRMIALAVTWVAATAGFGAAILSRGGTHRDAAKKTPVDESASWQTPTPITGVAAARKPVRT
ncbi:MAG TPA: polymer-forming cytoskeletal protein [Gemmatimonadaceae bacterium]